VTALNQQARAWWEHLGFQPLDPTDATGTDLYLTTADIEATIRGRCSPDGV
jgi:hypothetical protein